MKFIGVLCLALFVCVNAAPREEVKNEQQQASTEIFGTPEMLQMDDNTTIDLDGEGTTPSIQFTEEVIQYFQQKKNQNEHSRVTRQNNEGVLQHGDTIALQSFVRLYWASCSARYCNRNSCPRMQMTGSDWTNCWGEKFRIYRADGPGEVQVGDLVGLYYPHQSGSWLGCPGSTCAKASCPGQPSTTHGFATDESWSRCWGEVFKIYSKNKSLGATIHSDDEVSFFYIQDQNWLALGYDNMVKFPCLGTTRPPPLSNYDVCAYETFRLWKN